MIVVIKLCCEEVDQINIFGMHIWGYFSVFNISNNCQPLLDLKKCMFNIYRRSWVSNLCFAKKKSNPLSNPANVTQILPFDL